MKHAAGLRECLILGILIMGALLFLYGKDTGKAAVSAVETYAVGYAQDVQADADPEEEKQAAELEGKDEPAESKGKIALTFDDGPHPLYTKPLLDGLRERDVKATFFLMGKNAEEYPQLVRQMKEDGHLIGNHTYSHLQLNHSNAEQFKQELEHTSSLLENLTGETPEFVRPPFGTWEKKFEEELNMFPVLWTIDPLDWCSNNADCIARNVIAKARENDIILMHDQYPSSVTAALRIVDVLQKEGYEFVTVEEILFD